jgi:hypothetical protein
MGLYENKQSPEMKTQSPPPNRNILPEWTYRARIRINQVRSMGFGQLLVNAPYSRNEHEYQRQGRMSRKRRQIRRKKRHSKTMHVPNQGGTTGTKVHGWKVRRNTAILNRKLHQSTGIKPLMSRLRVAAVGSVPDEVTHIYRAYEDAEDAEVLGFLET